MIEAVDFSRRQVPQPRLSKPYVRGRHAESGWSPAEDAIMRKHYPAGGLAACLDKLPKRSSSAIYMHARALGLSRSGQQAPHRRRPAADVARIDAALKESWPSLAGRGALAALAEQLGQPRNYLTQRATVLGLTKAHRVKEPKWTEAEIALMARVPLHDPKRAAGIFAEHGFARSGTALVVKAKRLGLSRRRRDVLSARGAAAILGVDDKWITARCIEGRLAAEKRGTARLVQQGGDTWSIAPAALRAFVLAHLEEIDIRKVEKFAFVALLAGEERS